MNKTIKELLTATAFYTVVASGVVTVSPYIINHVIDAYQEMQLKASLAKYDEGATNGSRQMMAMKKRMIVNINGGGSSGSGAHLTPNIILTARHVAENLNKNSLVKTTLNGKVEIKRVTGVVLHPTLDMALVLVGDSDIKTEKLLLKFRTPVDEEKVYRIGFSQAKQINSSEGRYEADESPSEEKLVGDWDIFYVGGAAGDSGSIIFGADGAAIGMVNAGPSDAVQASRDIIRDSGINDIPDTDTSITQDNMKTLIRKGVTFGYGRVLIIGTEELLALLETKGASFPPPKFNLFLTLGE